MKRLIRSAHPSPEQGTAPGILTVGSIGESLALASIRSAGGVSASLSAWWPPPHALLVSVPAPLSFPRDSCEAGLIVTADEALAPEGGRSDRALASGQCLTASVVVRSYYRRQAAARLAPISSPLSRGAAPGAGALVLSRRRRDRAGRPASRPLRTRSARPARRRARMELTCVRRYAEGCD